MVAPLRRFVLTPFDEVRAEATFRSTSTSHREHEMNMRNRLGLSVVAITLAMVGIASGASAGGDPTFQCVSVNVDTCTVTIPLTSNMNEVVGSTMPDSKPWYNSMDAGQGPYGLTGPGNPQTTWNGVGGALQGSVWTAVLTTNAGEPAGSEAVLTFQHVTSSTTTTGPAQPYTSIFESYPYGAPNGSKATITAVVHPIPSKGHLLLMRKNGTSWASMGAFTYSTATKKWSIKFTWHFPSRATETFRLLATAAPGLSATYGGNFKLHTEA